MLPIYALVKTKHSNDILFIIILIITIDVLTFITWTYPNNLDVGLKHCILYPPNILNPSIMSVSS